MKNIICGLSTFIFMFIGLMVVNADNGPTISGNNSVKEGETISLSAIFPDGCMGRKSEDTVCTQAIEDVTSEVSWTSSNESAATISDSGLVTGVKEGTTVITATYTHSDGEKVSSDYNINVTKSTPKTYQNLMVLVLFSDENGQYDEVSTLTWNLGKEGDTTKIRPKLCDFTNLKSDNTYDESLCSDIDILYMPSDNDVVKIDNNGTITNLKEGETTITVKAIDEITILTVPTIKKTPSVTLKVKVTNEEVTSEEDKEIKKYDAPNTASPASIIAIVTSVLLLIFAIVYYFTVINKLKTWKVDK